ncbi:unnamed protein product [Paramecium primaurelia]|uniref:Uncharacterized protein n=1 Tax=Paramecium primaurelia TaxID=5886 RepID=A0A8S1NAQ1_PARPR|nr:unnamed protein product [Paramecium primaurelia]
MMEILLKMMNVTINRKQQQEYVTKWFKYQQIEHLNLIISNFPKPLFQSVGTSQIYFATRLFQLSYTISIIISDDFQIKDDLYFHIQRKQNVQQMNQSINLTQNTSQINEFNSSHLILMINITCSRSSQDKILLIKFLNNSVIFSNERYSQIETEVSCLKPKVTYIDDVTIAQVQIAPNSNTYIFHFIGIIFGYQCYNLQTYFQLLGYAQFNFIQKIFDLSGIIDQILKTQQLKKIPTKVAGDNLISLLQLKQLLQF